MIASPLHAGPARPARAPSTAVYPTPLPPENIAWSLTGPYHHLFTCHFKFSY